MKQPEHADKQAFLRTFRKTKFRRGANAQGAVSGILKTENEGKC